MAYQYLRQYLNQEISTTWPVEIQNIEELMLSLNSKKNMDVLNDKEQIVNSNTSIILAGKCNVDIFRQQDKIIYQSATTTVCKANVLTGNSSTNKICKSIKWSNVDGNEEHPQQQQKTDNNNNNNNNNNNDKIYSNIAKRICNEIKTIQILAKTKKEDSNIKSNIIQLFDVSITKNRNDQLLYINMIYNDAGLDLRKLLKYQNLKQFEPKFIIYVMKNLFNVLTFLHENRWCHRDIKPENICYSLHNKTITLIDFDFAIVYDEPIRENNNGEEEIDIPKDVKRLKGAVGTAGFIPPEMFTNSYYNGMAADIWSAGITFLELLLHQELFEKYILQTYAANNMMDIDVFKTKIYKMLKNIKTCMSEEIFLTRDIQMFIRNMLKLDYSKRPTANELYIEFQKDFNLFV